MKTVTLYTTHCPRCNVLASKLDSAGIEYDICEDEDEMVAKGMMSSPILEIDGELLDFKSAVDWISEEVSSK